MTEYRELHRVVLAYVVQAFQQISGRLLSLPVEGIIAHRSLGINLITYYAPIL